MCKFSVCLPTILLHHCSSVNVVLLLNLCAKLVIKPIKLLLLWRFVSWFITCKFKQILCSQVSAPPDVVIYMCYQKWYLKSKFWSASACLLAVMNSFISALDDLLHRFKERIDLVRRTFMILSVLWVNILTDLWVSKFKFTPNL